LYIPPEYLSFINPTKSIPSPSFASDIFTPTFADPTECRSFTFLPLDPNPVVPFRLKDHLLSCFFTHFHRHYPILLLPDFFELCYPVCRHPSYLMNVIYAMGSVFSRHPAIVKDISNITTATTTLGNSLARIAATELRQISIEDLDDNERPGFIIATLLVCVYENSMNIDNRFNNPSSTSRHFLNHILQQDIILHSLYETSLINR